MSPRPTLSQPPWLWPLVLVTSFQLLFTAGATWITDHGEIVAVAHRFIGAFRLDLENLGPGFEDWTRIAQARDTSQTRFLPLSILVLTPFLAVDHLAGFRDPASFRFVHLQGHVFVALGLALIGRHATGLGVGATTTALSVLLAGLNWPVFMVARRLGPEPLLFALLAWFATGNLWSRVAVLLLLPWTHATGPLLGMGLLLWAGATGAGGRRVAGLSAAWAAGGISLVLLWNLRVHGHILLGGYGQYSSDPFFTLRNPVSGIASFVAPMILWTLPIAYLVARAARKNLRPTIALFLPAVVFFGLFSTPEPERRLAPLLAPLVVTVVSAPLHLSPALILGLVLSALLSGLTGLSRDFVDIIPTPWGTYAGPVLLLVREAFVENRPGLSALLAVALIGTMVLAARQTLNLFLRETLPPVGPNHATGPESAS